MMAKASNDVTVITETRNLFERLQTAQISSPSPRDRLLLGILDNKIRDRLLRQNKPTVKKTHEIGRASESMLNQIKAVEGNAGALIIEMNPNESA